MIVHTRCLRWLTAGAALLLLCAFVWSLRLIAEEPHFRRAYERQMTLLSQLSELEDQANALASYEAPFLTDNAIDPQSYSKQFFTDHSSMPAITTTKSMITDRFTLTRITVDYERVDYSVLADRIQRAEGSRPPLKLKSCIFEAASDETGAGKARLSFDMITGTIR